MVALLGELVSKGEPVLLYEGLEPIHRTVVRVKENLCQGNNLKEGGRFFLQVTNLYTQVYIHIHIH